MNDRVPRVNMTEQEFERRLNEAHVVGRAGVYEELAVKFLADAGRKYANGEDSLARYLRDTVAPEMQLRGFAERDRQKVLQEEPVS